MRSGVPRSGGRLRAISDGTFVARPSYFGDDVAPNARPDVFDRDGAAWLPIGCFLTRTSDRLVLVDVGVGRLRRQLPDGMELSGGDLLGVLTAAGTARTDITDVICTHLHSDHVGWLFDGDARRFFPEATIWFGAADAEYFVNGPGEMDEHVREGFLSRANRSFLRPLSRGTEVAPGVITVATPGHTPGHMCVAVDLRGRRCLLLGDAITHPVQLEEPAWHSFGDVDVELAHSTRERLWRALAESGVTGVGAHFPALRPGYVDTADGRRWSTRSPFG
jgi:glyoxylase-like metal-dependent hydrolase (beta-lactamase superfamily II)